MSVYFQAFDDASLVYNWYVSTLFWGIGSRLIKTRAHNELLKYSPLICPWSFWLGLWCRRKRLSVFSHTEQQIKGIVWNNARKSEYIFSDLVTHEDWIGHLKYNPRLRQMSEKKERSWCQCFSCSKDTVLLAELVLLYFMQVSYITAFYFIAYWEGKGSVFFGDHRVWLKLHGLAHLVT